VCTLIGLLAQRPENFSVFRKPDKNMPLHSAFEDLKGTTLRKVSGLLRKLDYLSQLRKKDGKYSHWGLSRVYGEAAAHEALSKAHEDAAAEVLQTPLRKMVQDAEISGGDHGVAAEAYAEELLGRAPELLPTEPSAGATRHLRSVLRVLSYLTKTR
jgi:hypothetical protein